MICPNCNKEYKPLLRRIDGRPIQEQYPNEPAWKREQLITGICSKRCWKESIGGED